EDAEARSGAADRPRRPLERGANVRVVGAPGEAEARRDVERAEEPRVRGAGVEQCRQHIDALRAFDLADDRSLTTDALQVLVGGLAAEPGRARREREAATAGW